MVDICPLFAPAACPSWGFPLAFSAIAQHDLVPNGSGDGRAGLFGDC